MWSLLSWFWPAGSVRFIACETERGKAGGAARVRRNSIEWAGCEVLAWGTGFPDAWRSEWCEEKSVVILCACFGVLLSYVCGVGANLLFL